MVQPSGARDFPRVPCGVESYWHNSENIMALAPVNASVRWLYQRHSMNETALCFRGARFGNVVVIDYPIRVYTMPLREMDQLRPVEYRGGDYPIRKAVDLFRVTQEKNGITKGADRLLSIIENGWTEIDPEVLDVKPSEETMHVVRPPVTLDGEPVNYDPATFAKGAILGEEGLPTKRRRKSSDGAVTAGGAEKPTPMKESDGKPSGTKRGTILGAICAELGIDPADARKRLRGAGMRAPYDNEAAIRGALK